MGQANFRSAAFALVAAYTPLSEENHRAAFEAHKDEYSKHYESEEEEQARYEIFKTNRDYVQQYNNDSDGAQLGLNEFSDLSHEEFTARYVGGYKPSLMKQWEGAAYLGQHEYSGAAVPESVDWTTDGAVTPVKNQGQCGSCWSFSATGSLEGAWQIASKKLVSISEQQLVDCSGPEGNQGCHGGLMDDAFQYMEKNAMCTEESYAYTAKEGKKCKAKKCKVGIPKGSITGFKDVSPDDENAMMEALAQGPVSIAIEADKSAFQMYKSGVLTTMCGSNLDHGVLAVGYGELDGKKYWKVKNSWGPSWGQEGFILLSRGKGADGECGLLKQPSYPVVKVTDEIFV